ncbi:MAG: ECF transporter S component [Clostridia bacterium]|nr:ECF transporter S component [Clostridia bacterium]
MKTNNKTFKMPWFTLLIILILVPATIFFGNKFLSERQHYFVSLAIILEILIPFLAGFEHKKPKAREIVLLAILTALAVGSRLLFASVSHFKPTLTIIMLSGIAFGGNIGFLTGALTAFVSNMFFGQGPWTPWQMFTMGICGFVAGLIFYNRPKLIKSPILGAFGFLSIIVLYGGILNTSSALVWEQNINFGIIWSYIVLGAPFDALHGVATAFFMFVLGKPVLQKINHIKIKYNL